MPSKVVVTRDLGAEAMNIIRQNDDLDIILWEDDAPVNRTWLEDKIKGAVGVLVMLTDKVDEALLEKAGPTLKVVSTMSVGYEHVDTVSMAKRGIKLGFTPDVLTDAVADISVMLALMASRNAGEAISIVQNGKWPTLGWGPFTLCGPQIGSSGSTIGFLGFGRISKATLHRLVPFGVSRCIYSSRRPIDEAEHQELETKYNIKLEYVDQDRLAKESDVLFVLVPGGKATYHLVDETFLRKMKSTAILVNTARGTVVDSDALATALREKWIWGAGLDVVEGEPHISTDHPLVKEPRAVVLPHIGSATLDTRTAMATRAARNLVQGVKGLTLEAEVMV